jgi:hypothetical protein
MTTSERPPTTAPEDNGQRQTQHLKSHHRFIVAATVLAVALALSVTLLCTKRHSVSQGLPPPLGWDDDFSWTHTGFFPYDGENGCRAMLPRLKWRTIKGDRHLEYACKMEVTPGQWYCGLPVRPGMIVDKESQADDPVPCWPAGFISAKDLKTTLERMYFTKGNYQRVLDENGDSILSYDDRKLDDLFDLLSQNWPTRVSDLDAEDPGLAAAEVLVRLATDKPRLRDQIVRRLHAVADPDNKKTHPRARFRAQEALERIEGTPGAPKP